MKYEGTALGCIGWCKACGKAIQLRRFNDQTGLWTWVHTAISNHPAVLNPGVLEVEF